MFLKFKVCLFLIINFCFANIYYAQNFWQYSGLNPGYINDVEVNSNNIVYAGFASSSGSQPLKGLVRSNDRGITWEQVPPPGTPSPFWNLNLDTHIKNNDHIFNGSTPFYFYRTTDGGNTWNPYNFDYTPKKITSHPGGTLFASTDGIIQKSTNEGLTWTWVKTLQTDFEPYVLTVNPNNGYIYASFTWVHTNGSLETEFYRSTNTGANWTQIGSPVFDSKKINCLEFSSSQGFFLGTNEGLYISTDNGNSFTLIPTGVITENIICMAINSEDEIYLGTVDNGVFVSNDLGSNWATINSGLTELSILALKFDNEGFLYAGTSNWAGIFRSIYSTTSSAELTQPNGGENWPATTQQEIIWSSIYVDNIKIEYSTNNGANWLTITNSTPANTGSFTWLVPNTLSTQCLVKISDVVNSSLLDISDNVFTISEEPTITVTSPIAGTIWIIETEATITWSSTNVSGNVNLKLSTDGGSNFLITLASNTTNDGTESIIVSNNPSTTCRIRVEAVNNPNNIYGLNDGNFTIVQPSITVNSPNGGEILIIGTTYDINWVSQYVENVKLEYSITNGSSWLLIESSIQSTGNYSWTVPNTPSTQCKIRISHATNATFFDESDGAFTITNPVEVNELTKDLPTQYVLSQNFPNPFNPSTRIYYSVPSESIVTIKLFNTLGEEVGILLNEIKSPGNYFLDFNISNLKSGVYIYQMKSEGYSLSKKMMIVK